MSSDNDILFAEWSAENYHHSISLKGEHFWEDKNLPRKAGNPIMRTADIFKLFKSNKMEKESLKEGPRPVSESKSFDFGTAIVWLKAGSKVARTGWNGKGMFLYLVPANRYPAATDIGKQIGISETGGTREWDGKVAYTAYVAIKTVQGNVSPWQPSNNDMLSEDWEVVA